VKQESIQSQSRLGVRLRFQFGLEQLTYTLRDRTGELQFSVPYEAINILAPTRFVSNNRPFVRRLYFIPVILVVASLILSKFDKPLSGGLAVLGVASIVGIVGGAFFRLFAIKYTMLVMSPKPPGIATNKIKIIDDASHSVILEEIKTRWRARMRDLHGSVNFVNDPDKELAKFGWLKQQGVVTEEEYREAVEKLRAYVVGIQSKQQADRSLN
jgi:hypothetical protein